MPATTSQEDLQILTRNMFRNILRDMKKNAVSSLLILSLALATLHAPIAAGAGAEEPEIPRNPPAPEASTSGTTTPGEHQEEAPLSKMSVEEQLSVVQALSRVLKENYLFQDEAKEMARELEDFSSETFVEAIEERQLANLLTQKLFELSGDLHFFVDIDQEWVEEQRLQDDPKRRQESREAQQLLEEQQNFFFKEVKILEGNVGYLNFSRFANPELGYRGLASSMEFLSHCDAYILDLRNNNGGVLEMAQLLASFFFSSDSDQLLFDIGYFEDGRKIERKQWVLPSVPGKRRPDAPLYILVSSTSFSAAEWFAFVMGGLGRAEVVGERTAGGAHPVDRKVIDERFVVNVPIGEIRGPVGEGDFEGVGVEPNEAVEAAEALHFAHKMALEELMGRNPKARTDYEWYLPVVEARHHPIALDTEELQAIAGSYDHRTISTERGSLYYSWNGKSRTKLTPLSKTLFSLEGIDDFRFKLIEGEGTAIGLERIYSDGRPPSVRWRTAGGNDPS